MPYWWQVRCSTMPANDLMVCSCNFHQRCCWWELLQATAAPCRTATAGTNGFVSAQPPVCLKDRIFLPSSCSYALCLFEGPQKEPSGSWPQQWRPWNILWQMPCSYLASPVSTKATAATYTYNYTCLRTNWDNWDILPSLLS